MSTAKPKTTPQAIRLIELLTNDATSDVDFRTLPEMEAAHKRLQAGPMRLKFHGTFAELEPTLRKRNAAGFGVFYSLNETDGNGTKKQNIVAVRALPLDLDGAPLPEDWGDFDRI